MYNFHTFKSVIGGVKKYVTRIEVDLGDTKPSTKPVHHLFMFDRSGSMKYDISALITQMQAALVAVDTQDRVTIAWFSGEDQYDIFYKFVQPDLDLIQSLRHLDSTIGTTCFSQTLNALKDIENKYSDQCEYSALHMFTDGYPVCSRPTAEEERLSLEAVSKFVNLSSVNTVGFSNNYNEGFLRELSKVGFGGLGKFNHVSNIDNYQDLLKSNIHSVSNLVSDTAIEISTKEKSDILYVSDRNTKLGRSTLTVGCLDDHMLSNVFYVVSDSLINISINGNIEYSDKNYNVVSAKDLIKFATYETVDEFKYAFASELYYEGSRLSAQDIIVSGLRDKHIADLMVNAFTRDEVSAAQLALNDAVFDPSFRLIDGLTSPTYRPRSDAFCVMDLLSMIASDGESLYYPGETDYQRTTRKTVDEFDAFFPSPDPVCPVDNLVWNKDRCNLSIRYKVDGIVKLNPRSAKAVGLPLEVPSFVWRNHTFIKDGVLNINKATFGISRKLFTALSSNKKANLQKFAEIGITNEKDGYTYVTFNLSKLPLINRTLISSSVSISNLAKAALDTAVYEAQLKVLEIERFKLNTTLQSSGSSDTKTSAQIQVLSDHGIRSDGSYQGIAPTVESAANSDSYVTKSFIFQIKGASTLPTAKEYEQMKLGEKKVNLPGDWMVNFYHSSYPVNLNPSEHSAYYNQLFDSTKKKLTVLRQYLAEVKMACLLTGDFFVGVTVSGKDNEYTYDMGDGNTLVIKTKLGVEYV